MRGPVRYQSAKSSKRFGAIYSRGRPLLVAKRPSCSPPHLPSLIAPCYSNWMSDETRYIVSILEPVGGKLGWRTLLNTKDLEEANALIAAMEQDGVRSKFDVILPRKRKL